MTRHPLDLFSLLSGLALTGIALAALFGISTTLASWVWPVVLVLLGVVVVVAALGRDTDTAAPDEVAADPDRAAAVAAARDEVEQVDHTTE